MKYNIKTISDFKHKGANTRQQRKNDCNGFCYTK